MTWIIESYSADFLNSRGVIERSRGIPYRELLHIAKRMNRNGEGQRYRVIRAPVQEVIHHVNGDATDNTPSNLRLVRIDESRRGR